MLFSLHKPFIHFIKQMAFLSLYHTGIHHSYTACLSAGTSLNFQNSVNVIFSSIFPGENIGTSFPSFRNSATTSTYTLFIPTPHYKISIALGDAGILRIYPFCSNCLILEKQMTLILLRSVFQIPELSADIHAPSYNSKCTDSFLPVLWLMSVSNLSLPLSMKITVWMNCMCTSVQVG